MNKSPLKWAGGKSRHLPLLASYLQNHSYRRLIEPMAGSSVISLNADYKSIVVGDSNTDLICFYKVLANHTEEVIEKTRTYFTKYYNQNDLYRWIRMCFNAALPVLDHIGRITWAAQFLYLNRHCYNGLCRYNRKGNFNVPFGKYTKPYFPEKELVYFGEWVKANDVQFFCGDVLDALSFTMPGDCVIIDPPFVPLSDTANFTSYDGKVFNWECHVRLAEASRRAVERGAVVLVFNHNTEATKALYVGAEVIEYDASRNISCDGENRKKAKELLAVFK